MKKSSTGVKPLCRPQFDALNTIHEPAYITLPSTYDCFSQYSTSTMQPAMYFYC